MKSHLQSSAGSQSKNNLIVDPANQELWDSSIAWHTAAGFVEKKFLIGPESYPEEVWASQDLCESCNLEKKQ